MLKITALGADFSRSTEVLPALDPLASNVVFQVDFARHPFEDAARGLPTGFHGAPVIGANGITLNGIDEAAEWPMGPLGFTGDFCLEMLGLALTDLSKTVDVFGNGVVGGTYNLHVRWGSVSQSWLVWVRTTAGTLALFLPDTPPAGVPIHLCVERDGTTVRVYRDGVVIGSGTIAGDILQPSRDLYLGTRQETPLLAPMSVRAVRLTARARYRGAFAPPPAFAAPTIHIPEPDRELLARGAWSLISSPLAAGMGKSVLFPVIGATEARLMEWRPGRGAAIMKAQHPTAGGNDRTVGSILRLANGEVLYANAAVTSSALYVSVGSDAPLNIAGQLGGSAYTYTHLAQAPSAPGAPVYLFGRATVNGARRLMMSRSDDGGRSWTGYTPFISNGTDGADAKDFPYIAAVGHRDRIDFLVADRDPVSAGSHSIRHFYMRDGRCYRTDGTLIGSALPIATTDMTLVHDGAAAPAMVADLRVIDGELVALFATYPSVSAQRYWRARWSGSAWITDVVVDDAGPSMDANDAYNQVGACMHPTNAAVVYAARMTSDGRRQIFAYSHDGAGWRSAQITRSTLLSAFRPVACANPLSLLFLVSPNYASYVTHGSTSVAAIPLVGSDPALPPQGAASAVAVADVQVFDTDAEAAAYSADHPTAIVFSREGLL